MSGDVVRFPNHPEHFLLDADHRPFPVADFRTWALGMEACRRIAITEIASDVAVSTVFLGLNHGSPLSGGPPILFETMIFGGPLDQYQTRYETYDAALAGHEIVVAMARGSFGEIVKAGASDR